MSVLIILVPLALLLSFAFMAAFAWATRTGQWDDIDLAPYKAINEQTPGKGPHEPEN